MDEILVKCSALWGVEGCKPKVNERSDPTLSVEYPKFST